MSSPGARSPVFGELAQAEEAVAGEATQTAATMMMRPLSVQRLQCSTQAWVSSSSSACNQMAPRAQQGCSSSDHPQYLDRQQPPRHSNPYSISSTKPHGQRQQLSAGRCQQLWRQQLPMRLCSGRSGRILMGRKLQSGGSRHTCSRCRTILRGSLWAPSCRR